MNFTFPRVNILYYLVLYVNNFSFTHLLLHKEITHKVKKLDFTMELKRKTTGTLFFLLTHTPEENSFKHFCFGSSGGYIWISKQYVYTIWLVAYQLLAKYGNWLCPQASVSSTATWPLLSSRFYSHYFPFSYKLPSQCNTILNSPILVSLDLDNTLVFLFPLCTIKSL